MCDNHSENETDEQDPNISRRTAFVLLGTGAVGSSAATSAFSELNVTRSADIEVTEDTPVVVVADSDGSALEITNNSGSSIYAEIETTDDSVEFVSATGASVSGNGPWTVEAIPDSDTATIAFRHDDEQRELEGVSVDFDVTAFTETSGFGVSITETVAVDFTDSLIYESQERVRDVWDTLYEIPSESDIQNEEPLLEEDSLHPLAQWEVGSFDDSFEITHGEMGRYTVADRQDDGSYWITAVADDGSDSSYAWGASTEIQFDGISTIGFRYSGDNTDRQASGFEIGIENDVFLAVFGSASLDAIETYDVSHISGEQTVYIWANGSGRHDEGTRMSVTEISFETEENEISDDDDLEITNDPYESVEWELIDQRYYEFHAHIRENEPPETEEGYAAAGYGGLTVGDDPCRDHRDQEYFYWPWENDPETYDDTHDDGMVGIPGGEHGDDLQHVVGINTQHELDCDIDSEAEMISNLIDDPELDDIPCVVYVTHPGISATALADLFGNEENFLGCDGWTSSSGSYWDKYHDVLDRERKFWHFASDDYSPGRKEVLDANRTYIPIEDHNPENAIAALQEGAFYCGHAPDSFDGTNDTSNIEDPPEIDAIDVDPSAETITIDSSDADSCEWISSGGDTLTTGFTLEYNDFTQELHDSWAYARVQNGSGESRTQPWAFDVPE